MEEKVYNRYVGEQRQGHLRVQNRHDPEPGKGYGEKKRGEPATAPMGPKRAQETKMAGLYREEQLGGREAQPLRLQKFRVYQPGGPCDRVGLRDAGRS